MIVPSRFGGLIKHQPDLHLTVWVDFQWNRLPIWRRAWLWMLGRKPVTLEHFRSHYLEFIDPPKSL